MQQMSNFTKYEKARMIGARALQIAMGAPTLVPLTPEQLAAIGFSPIRIAEMEYDKGIIPLTVKRQIKAGAKLATDGADGAEEEAD